MPKQTTCKCGHNKMAHVVKGCLLCKCKSYRPVNSR